MPRTSPVYYISPSAISITPNANYSARDLAVYIARNARIRIFSSYISELDTIGGSYQEWSLAGRNRRLADATAPYTIYARLRKVPANASDEEREAAYADGYLLFVKKDRHNDAWVDHWSSPVSGGNGYSVLYMEGDRPVQRTDSTFWYVRLGDVSAPENGKRTVGLDTGILGTDQYNSEWVLNPDDMPLRVEISNSKEAGVPYVNWGDSITLEAGLVQGWEDDASDRVHHWTISRDSGDADADDAWNHPGDGSSDSSSSGEDEERSPHLMPNGRITLRHIFGGTDDMNAAVAPVFTITAWAIDPKEESSSSSSSGDDSSSSEEEEPAYTELARADITILAETVFTFGLELSAGVISYNPTTQTYAPAGGSGIRVKCQAQDGSVSYASNALITAAQLHLYYLPVNEDAGDDPLPELTFVNGVATLPTSAFADGKSKSLWLENGAQVELARETVAYVRFGEKGDTPITCYRWYKKGLTPLVPTDVTSEEPAPATGDATGAGNVYPLNKWSKTTPNRPATGDWHLWMCESIHHGSGTIDAWNGPVRVSGDDGTPGVDASDREYIYKGLATYPFSGTLPANINTGTIPDPDNPGQRIASNDKTKNDWVPDGWSDTAIPTDDTNNKYVYISIREKAAGNDQQWGAFSTPALWSNWGRQGIDGDGVQYIYKLFDHELTSTERTSQVPTNATQDQDGEWMPTPTDPPGVNNGWSDDPLAPTSSMPFCYCSIIKKINGSWNKSGNYGVFEKLGLWSKWAKDGAPGGNTATVYLYKRSASPISTVDITITLYYKFQKDANNKNLFTNSACTTPFTDQTQGGNGWSPVIPSGTDPIYVTAAIAYSANEYDDLGTNEWVTPVQYTENGAKGINTATVFLYQRSASAPTGTAVSPQQTLYYKFEDGNLYKDAALTQEATKNDGLNGWETKVPTSDGNPCYIIQAAALSADDYDAIEVVPAQNKNDWSSVRKLVEDGGDGVDAKDAEWAYIRTKTNVAPVISSDSTYTDSNGNVYTDDGHLPKVAPGTGGSASDIEDNNSGIVSKPYECTAKPQGVNDTWKYEWELKRTKGAAVDGHRSWNPYSGSMTIHNNCAVNGEIPASLYKQEVSGTAVSAPSVSASDYMDGTNLGGWSKTAPNRTDGYDIWMSQNTILTDISGNYSLKNNSWSPPTRISGDQGDPGADSKEREWIYKGSTTNTTPATPTNPTDRTIDDYVPAGWDDNAIAVDDTTNKFVFASYRDWNKTTQRWGDFQTPILWSNWGVQGMDGDGVQYIYKLFDHELTNAERTSNIPTNATLDSTTKEWMPSSSDPTSVNYGWYDDPLAPTEQMPFCYCSIIKKINGSWNTSGIYGVFEKLGLWSKWSEDGAGQPDYIQTQEAWSNVESVVSDTTEPTPNSGWSDTVPSNPNNYAYLWRRSRKMVLQSDGTTYDVASGPDGQWKYTRLSGTNGTSIKTKGTLAAVVLASGTLPTTGVSVGDLGIKQGSSQVYRYQQVYASSYAWVEYATAADGDSYTMTKDRVIDLDGDGTSENIKGHLLMWSDEASKWIDLGQFKGDSGTTYYTHIAWATDVDTSIHWSGTIPDGQISTPNYGNGAVTGGSTTPSSDGSKPWMGVLINTDSGADTTHWHYYTWTYSKGADGDDAEVYALKCSPDSIAFHSDATGTFSGSYTVECTVVKTVGAVSEELSGVPTGMYLKSRLWYDNGTYVNWIAGAARTIYATDAVNNHVSGVEFALSNNSSMTDIVASKTVPVICDGRIGAAGTTGKMFYPMGEWQEQSYSKTDIYIPLVHYNDGEFSEATGEGNYYYLNADSASSGDVPGTSNKWTKAHGYGVVITQGLFAEFAKLGKAVYSGDYSFSMDGKIDGVDYMAGAYWKDRPAYTLFAGDPSVYGISFPEQETTLYSSSYTALHDGILLQAGVPVVLKLTVISRSGGNAQVGVFTASGSSSLEFEYSGNAGAQTPWNTVSAGGYINVWFGYTYYIRFTPSTTGYYCLKGMSSSGTCTIEYTVKRLIFEPNYWIDMMTGKTYQGDAVVTGVIHATGGEFTGTIKASNFYHRLAISSGMAANSTREATFLVDDGVSKYCVYCKADYGDCEQGKYYTGTAAELNAIVGGDDWRDDTNHFILCTGDADEVLITNNNSGSSAPQSSIVHLPRCEDYTGKIVTVRNVSTTLGAIYVKQADDATGKFAISPEVDTINNPYSINYGSNTQYKYDMSSYETAMFYSTGTVWLILSSWQS